MKPCVQMIAAGLTLILGALLAACALARKE